MINVYQINWTTEQLNEINNTNPPPDYFNAYMKTVWDGDVYEAWDKGLYEHVADVNVNHMETAFVVMNRWSDEDETLVSRHKPLHSMSIGDIIINPDLAPDRCTEYAVASVGFSPLKLEWKNAK